MEAVLHGSFGHIVLGSTIITLGRAQDNHLVISDTKVSAHHALIRPAWRGYSIVDLGSMNGTFVNGQRLVRDTPRLLNPADTIRLGDTVYTYEMRAVTSVPYHLPAIPMHPSDATTELGKTVFTTTVPSTVSGRTRPVGNPSTPIPLHYTPSTITPIPPGLYDNAASLQIMGKKRKGVRALFFIGGSILFVGILIMLMVNYSLLLAVAGPTDALQTYCNALKSHNYSSAYNLLDASSQQRIALADFAQYASDNSGAGNVADCSVSSVGVMNASGVGIITYVFANGSSKSRSYTLRREYNLWKIVNVTASTPHMMLTTYCGAIALQNYQVAYEQLSGQTRSGLTEAEFANKFRNDGIRGCEATNIQQSGVTVSVTLVYKNARGESIIYNAHLINENDIWKLNDQQQA